MDYLIKRRTFLTFVLVILLSFNLISCFERFFPQSSSSPLPETSPSPAYQVSVPLPETIPPTQPWKITVVLKTEDDPYWQRIKKAAVAYTKDNPIEITIKSSNQKQRAEFVEDQIQLLATQLDLNQMDGLILGPADSLRLVPIVERIANQGIPVIIIDTPLESTSILTFVGFDNIAGGELIGQWVGEQLNKKGNILILEGARHNDNAVQRNKGFLRGLRGKKIKILASRSANWSAVEAQETTRDWLDMYPKINAIVAANDEMALGAIAALEEVGRSSILVTGFDGSQKGLAAIASGKLGATIDQIPEYQVKLAIDLMINYLETQTPLPPEILLKNKNLINRQ